MLIRWYRAYQISDAEFLSTNQRWSPRGHILKSLALASKVKSLALASRLQVLENWPVSGSRTALFFELLKFCGDRLKNFCEDFGEHLRLCPWPRAFLSSASRVPVLGKAVLGLGLGFFCVLGLGLEPCVLDSTSAKNTLYGHNFTPIVLYRSGFTQGGPKKRPVLFFSNITTRCFFGPSCL